MKRQIREQEEAKKSLELVRSDMNLEKWQVFTVRQRKKGGYREIVRKENSREMRLIIGKTEQGQEVGLLTTEDGKVFYGLLRLWEKAGEPDGHVNFTLHQLAEQLKLSDDARTYRFLRKHLANLRQIPLTFIDSYKTAKSQDTITVYFSILVSLEIFERRNWRPGERYFAFSKFKFDERILQAIKNRYVKLLRLDILKQLRSDIAFVLYRYLERVMFRETHFEIDLRTVAEMCGMSDSAPVWRIKQRIRKALKELEGKKLTHGRITRAEIVPSQSGSGWKCVFEKGPHLAHRELVPGDKGKVIQILRYRNESASDAKVAGSFNSWRPEGMARYRDEWSILLELAPGKYYYKFIVDGQWVCDPENPLRERDEKGNENSVLVLEEVQ